MVEETVELIKPKQLKNATHCKYILLQVGNGIYSYDECARMEILDDFVVTDFKIIEDTVLVMICKQKG